MTDSAAMTEGRFWSIVEELGWGRTTTDYRAVEKLLMSRLTRDEAAAMREHLRAAEGTLYKALDTWQREGVGHIRDDRYLGSDDGFSDLIAHIVGMGKAEFDAVIADPTLAKARFDSGDFTESFSYALPYVEDYDRLDPAHYVKRAQRLLDEKFPTHVKDIYDDEPKPLPMAINIETDLGAVEATVANVKADADFLTRALTEAAAGDLGAFRGARGQAACEAVKRIDAACPSPYFHPAAITNMVSDIANYLD